MTPIVLTLPKSGLSKYRPVMNRCARCGCEMPVTFEHEEYVEVTVWQDGGKDYCCEEHVRVQ